MIEMKLVADVDAGVGVAPGVGRRHLTLCVIILLLAFVPRAGHALLHGGEPLGGDEPEYDALAWGLSRTGAYTSQSGFSLAYYSPSDSAPTAYRAPGFPAVLSAVYTIFGHRTLPARMLLAAFGALGAVLVFLLALEVCGERRITREPLPPLWGRRRSQSR
jgi:4-amino-4-deoxy-L-arabinose transferase-like glycosyltransferase